MSDTAHHFYHTMYYPIPTPRERFSYNKKTSTKNKQKYASRTELSSTTKKFIDLIKKHQSLYTSLPFVTHIYLCNSLTFNATTPDSDIDLTFIIREGRIRTARFYSVLMFWFRGIKRGSKYYARRFCLTFYLTHEHTNLYHIKRPHADYYLAYWIAHLVPLMTREGEDPNHLLDHNSRIRAHLPNIPKHLPIQLDATRPLTEDNHIRNTLETIHSGRWGNIIELCIKTIRLPIIRWKKKNLRKTDTIITSDTMLKFHHDKRDTIYDAYKITTEKQK